MMSTAKKRPRLRTGASHSTCKEVGHMPDSTSIDTVMREV